jgi:DNA-binding CsgD family transcriptional regulator
MPDDLTQRLAALAIEVGAIEQQLASAAEPVVEKLRAMREQIMKLASDTHAISRQLHSSILEDLGAAAALTSEGASFSRREGVPVTDEAEDVPVMVPKDEAIGLHRIAKDLRRASMDRSHVHLRPPPTLTPRQHQVMQLLAEGHSAKEVAAIMHISTRTVEFHKYRAMEILGLRTSAELIHYAIKHGIVTV